MLGLGATEMLIIGGIIIMFFGATALPKLARGLAHARSEFQRASREATATTDAPEPTKEGGAQ